MRIKKRPFHFFLLAILLTIGIGYLINTLPPSYIVTWNIIALPLLPLIMLLFIGAIFSICTYLFNSYIQGLLLSLLVGMYLVLRVINLTNIFFLILLGILFGSLELFFLKKR